MGVWIFGCVLSKWMGRLGFWLSWMGGWVGGWVDNLSLLLLDFEVEF